MYQLKSGTLLILITTLITAVLMLMTGRDEVTLTIDTHDITSIDNKNSLSEKPQSTISSLDNEITSIENAPEQNTINSTISDLTETVNNIDPSTINSANNNKVKKIITIEPYMVVATSSQHEILDHIVQPIWMDQKLGDFKSVENRKVVFKIIPAESNELKDKNANDATNSADKFISKTIPAEYNYQQMPMYNGGYYIAPMPSYLMPSILPGNTERND